MMFFIHLLFFPLTLGLPQRSPNSDSGCQVQDVNSEIKNCSFPFIFNGQTYFGCTRDFHPGGKLWCSTAATDSFQYRQGEWGHCHRGCFQNDNSKEDYDVALDAFNAITDVQIDPDTCSCLDVNECKLGRKLLRSYQNLGKDHPLRKTIAEFLQAKKCENGVNGVNAIICCYSSITNIDEIQNQESPSWRPTKSDCGTSSVASSIIGGNQPKLGEINYMALLGYNVPRIGKRYYCGGSVINKFYVLTAAHCFFDLFGRRNDPIEIVLGEYNVNMDPDCTTRGTNCLPKAIRRVPSEIKIHEEYIPCVPTKGYDLALIKVNEPIPLYSEDQKLSSVIPICLPWKLNDPGRSLKSGTSVTVTGWGRLTNNLIEANTSLWRNKVFSPKLMKATVPIVSNPICNAIFKGVNYQVQDDIQLCAGTEEGIDSCTGDSGGPLVYHEFPSSPKFQVGIVSFGPRVCGTEGYPGVYTKVTTFVEWIGQNLI